jgi:hypothetical protein
MTNVTMKHFMSSFSMDDRRKWMKVWQVNIAFKRVQHIAWGKCLFGTSMVKRLSRSSRVQFLIAKLVTRKTIDLEFDFWTSYLLHLWFDYSLSTVDNALQKNLRFFSCWVHRNTFQVVSRVSICTTPEQ